jgi:hypothetical protein
VALRPSTGWAADSRCSGLGRNETLEGSAAVAPGRPGPPVAKPNYWAIRSADVARQGASIRCVAASDCLLGRRMRSGFAEIAAWRWRQWKCPVFAVTLSCVHCETSWTGLVPRILREPQECPNSACLATEPCLLSFPESSPGWVVAGRWYRSESLPSAKP